MNNSGSDSGNKENRPPRQRGLTSLTLEWLAEKFKRANKVKEELADGRYNIDSTKLAKALINGNPARDG